MFLLEVSINLFVLGAASGHVAAPGKISSSKPEGIYSFHYNLLQIFNLLKHNLKIIAVTNCHIIKSNCWLLCYVALCNAVNVLSEQRTKFLTAVIQCVNTITADTYPSKCLAWSPSCSCWFVYLSLPWITISGCWSLFIINLLLQVTSIFIFAFPVIEFFPSMDYIMKWKHDVYVSCIVYFVCCKRITTVTQPWKQPAVLNKNMVTSISSSCAPVLSACRSLSLPGV